MPSISNLAAFYAGLVVGAPIGMLILGLCAIARGPREPETIIVTVDADGRELSRRRLVAESEVSRN